MKRIISIFLILVLTLTLLPLSALSADDAGTPAAEAAPELSPETTPETTPEPTAEPAPEPTAAPTLAELLAAGGDVRWDGDYTLDDDLTIAAGTALTVAGRLEIPAGLTLRNDGALTLAGTAVVRGTLQNGQTGVITVRPEEAYASEAAHLTLAGPADGAAAGGTLINAGEIDLYGAMLVEEGAVFADTENPVLLKDGATLTGSGNAVSDAAGATLASAPQLSASGAGAVTLTGKYVLVLNANPDPSQRQSTGTLIFGGTGTAAQTVQGSESASYPSDVSAFADTGGYAVGQVKVIGARTYVCIAAGDACYVWMEQGLRADYAAAGKLDTAAAEMLAVYGGRPSRALTTLAGGELPARDGTGKLSILLEQLSSSSGYFAGEDGITAIHIKTPAAADYDYGDLDAYGGLLAHEGQHALFQYLICGGDSAAETPLRWLNEGLSVAAMDWVWGGDGNGSSGWLSTITDNDAVRGGSSLAYSVYRSDSGLDYGLPYLFVRYLTDQAAHKYDPLTGCRKFYETAFSGKTTAAYLETVFASLGLTDADGGALTYAKALEDFYIAAVVQAGSGVYGFYGDPVVANRVKYPIFNGASGAAYSLPGTGALILQPEGGSFTVPSDAGGDIVFVAFDEDDSASAWGGGLGTEDDPYQISGKSILSAIALNPSGYYKLTEDIDVSDSTVFTIDSFSGTLDGNGHSIKGLNAPLIYQNSGTIRNLTVELAIDGAYSGCVGGLVGYNTGTISNVSVTGSFTGRLTGTNPYGPPKAGALVGQNAGGKIFHCLAAADMSFTLPGNHVCLGQLAGENNGQIYNCVAAGSIRAAQTAAGAYQLYAGGLCGRLYDNMFTASLKWSYSITRLSVTASGAGNLLRLGRLVGCEEKRAYGNYVEACYGLTGMPAAGQTILAALADSACLYTDAQLRAQANYAGWDFTDVWQMPADGYPVFRGAAAVVPVPSVPKRTYYLGEPLDLTGATLAVGETSVPLTADLLFALPDMSAAGTRTVSGSYQAEPFSFEITVSVPESVTSLQLAAPARSSYYAGQLFDPSAAVLTAVVGGASVTVTSGYTVSKTTALATTDTSVAFTYCGVSVSQPITVLPKAILSIARSAGMDKTTFARGEALSLAGLTLALTYSDGEVVSGVTAADLSRYGLRLIRFHNGCAEEISATRTLNPVEDNAAELYIYLGDDLSAFLTSGLRRFVATLTITRAAYLPDQEIVMHTGVDEYLNTDSISDGSGNYSTRLVSGSLPAGVTAELPDANGTDFFYFYGTAGAVGSRALVYEIRDVDQNASFQVTVYLRVEPPSDECDILWATLGGFPCVVGGDTLTVVVPAGQSLTGLQLNASLSAGATQSVWNGTALDCTKAQSIVVTSQSGNRTKTYVIHAGAATEAALAQPGRVSRADSVVSWDAVDGATGYLVTLLRRVGDYDESVTSRIVTGTAFDMRDAITRSGSYLLSVRAVDSAGARPAGAAASSSVYYHTENLTPVTGVRLSGPASILRAQTGAYTAAVYPENAGDTRVEWSVVPLQGSATVDGQGVVTGVTAGSVKVRATASNGVYGELTVTVRERPAADILLRPRPDGAVPYELVMYDAQGETTEDAASAARYALLFDKSDLGTGKTPYTFAVEPTVLDALGEVIAQPVLSYATSDAGLAAVSVKNGTVTVTVQRGAAALGACTVTGTSKASGAEGSLAIYIRDYAPRLGAGQLTLNPRQTGGASAPLLASYGNTVTGAAIYEGAAESASLSAAFANDTVTVTARTALTNRTIRATLRVSCRNGETYALPLTVAVRNAEPSIAVRQSAPFNLFYRDSETTLTLSAKNAVITDVVLETEQTFAAQYNQDGGTVTLRYADPASPLLGSGGRPYASVTLLVSLEGYVQPVRRTFTVSAAATAPQLSLTPASSVVGTLPGLDRSCSMTVYDRTNRSALALDAGSVSCDAAFVSLTADYETDVLTLTLTGDAGGTAGLLIQNDNWTRAVKLTHRITVQSALPVASLAATTLKLNSVFTAQTATTPLRLNQANCAVASIRAAAAGTAAAQAEAAKISATYADGSVTVRFTDELSPARPGTYAFALTPVLADGTALKTLTLKVQVVSAVPAVSLASSTLRLNSAFAAEETASAGLRLGGSGYAVTAVTAMRDSRNTLDEGAVAFGLADGRLTAKLTAAVPDGTYAYMLTPTVQDTALGQSRQLAPLSVKVAVYRSAAVSASVSASGKLDTMKPDSAITYAVTRLVNIAGTVSSAALGGPDAERFNVALLPTRNRSGQQQLALTMRSGDTYAVRTVYKLNLILALDGVSAPVSTSTLSVRVTQSGLKLTAAPGSAAAFQSQDGSVAATYTLTLTSPAGAAIRSVALNAATAAALRRALGVSGVLESTVAADGRSAQVSVRLRDPARVRSGASYTVLLDVTPEGCASDVGPTRVKAVLRVYK